MTTTPPRKPSLSPPPSSKHDQLPHLRKIQHIQILDSPPDERYQISQSNNQSLHHHKLYNNNKIIEIEQPSSSPIQLDSHVSFSTPISQYYPEDDDLSQHQQGKVLTFKTYNLRIKDLTIIGRDQYQKKGIYSGIHKIKAEYLTTKMEMKQEIKMTQNQSRSKKEEDVQRSKLKLKADNMVKSLGYRSKQISKQQNKDRKKAQNRKKCKKMQQRLPMI